MFDAAIANLKHKIDLALKSTIGGIVAAASALIAMAFFCAAAFLWLEGRYGAIVASLVLGVAIDRGIIRSVDEPIFSFFPELSDLRSPEKEPIQLVHALTMSMGLEWVEATPDTGDENNDEARMHMAPDPCR